LKTPEVESYEVDLLAAQKHVNDMTEANGKVDRSN
jgi:hypothetical protein